MNNEPVALVSVRYSNEPYTFSQLKILPNGTHELYTHPVKELTDEEIIATVKDHFIGAIKVGIVLTNDNVLDFARAILRKAQEK